jgi:hypothetical protein
MADPTGIAVPGQTMTAQAEAGRDAYGRSRRARAPSPNRLPAGEAPPDARKLNGGREGPVPHRPDCGQSRLFSGRRDTARTMR